MHYGALSRPALVQVGPAPELSLVPIAIVAGKPAAEFRRTRCASSKAPTPASPAGRSRCACSTTAASRSTTRASDLRVRANDLVDDGDRGDLYHCDPLGAPAAPDAGERHGHRGRPAARAHRHRAGSSTSRRGWRADRGVRAAEPRADDGDDDGDAVARARAPSSSRRRSTISRPIIACARSCTRRSAPSGSTSTRGSPWWRARSITSTLAGPPAPMEKPAPTGQHHRFVDISDGARGVALLTRGLPEHEVVRDPDGQAPRWR